jgi:hypothetical protein
MAIADFPRFHRCRISQATGRFRLCCESKANQGDIEMPILIDVNGVMTNRTFDSS